MRGGRGEGHGLQPLGQHRDRVEDAGQGLEGEGHHPGQALGALAEPEHHRGGEDAQGPAEEQQVGDEGHQRQPHHEEVEAVEGEGQHAHHDDREEQLHEADHERARQELADRERRDEQIQEIAGPDLFEVRQADALLGSEEQVPEDQRADEEGHEVGGGPANTRRVADVAQVQRHEAPQHQIQKRPVDHLGQTHGAALVDVEVAAGHRPDAARVHRSAPLTWPRAICRKRASRSSAPWVSTSSLGVPVMRMRPW
ncbi:hypothetical protein D3C72_1413350 [compost metagenome]